MILSSSYVMGTLGSLPRYGAGASQVKPSFYMEFVAPPVPVPELFYYSMNSIMNTPFYVSRWLWIGYGSGKALWIGLLLVPLVNSRVPSIGYHICGRCSRRKYISLIKSSHARPRKPNNMDLIVIFV